jgi:DNA-binding MarR family transcriptional regulator
MSKPKLSDSQLIILSTAARAERAIGREDLKKLKAKGAALSQAVRGLITRGLLEEVPSGPQGAHWRQDQASGAFGLGITAAGYQALGIEPLEDKPRTRPTTKQDQLIALLSGDGITIAELGETLGWLPHTVRAALTRLRQKGLAIERVREDKVSRYRIVEGRKAA